MCQALPGLRCANNLRNNIQSVISTLESIDKELAPLNKIGYEEGQQLDNEQLDRWYALSDKRDELKEELRYVSNQYNMTRTGRKELAQDIKYLEAMKSKDEKVQSSISDLKQTLASAEYQYEKATLSAKHETAGVAKLKEVDSPETPQITFYSGKAKEAFDEMHNLMENGVDTSGNKVVSNVQRAAIAKALALVSASNRSNVGLAALKDDSYEPGIYGVFYGYDGSVYLSKAVDNDKLLLSDRLAFENGHEGTGLYARDEHTVLVEKTKEGYTNSDIRHYGRLTPARHTFAKIGTESQHILREAPEKDRQRMSDMAKEMANLLAENAGDSRSAGEQRLVDFPTKDETDRKNKSILLRAYKYALYSPNTYSKTAYANSWANQSKK